ncbi:hypothetical protein B0H14DRAFT_2964423 [Mycena olivaceomarginata]|nr:hypothetical protein B0H14DRAFT_2964423 [Mycena olivaceomarginata]
MNSLHQLLASFHTAYALYPPALAALPEKSLQPLLSRHESCWHFPKKTNPIWTGHCHVPLSSETSGAVSDTILLKSVEI